MIDQFHINGATHVLANAETILFLQMQPSAPHVYFACTECGKGYWTAKNIALGNRGGYTGARNIFYCGDGRECNCDPRALRCVVREAELITV